MTLENHDNGKCNFQHSLFAIQHIKMCYIVSDLPYILISVCLKHNANRWRLLRSQGCKPLNTLSIGKLQGCTPLSKPSIGKHANIVF